jgi:hypothetical protein
MGTIDIHVHSDPDNRPRSIDAIDVAKLARDRGMRAIVSRITTIPPGRWLISSARKSRVSKFSVEST